MLTVNKTIEFQTGQELDFIDITDKVEEFVRESQAKSGIVNVQILHTSAGLIVNENEPLLLEDLKENLRKTAPRNLNYQHNDLTKRTVNVCPGECINAHSHCQAIHLLVSATLNLVEGKLQLGQWQRIFLVELDRPRTRRIQLLISGE